MKPFPDWGLQIVRKNIDATLTLPEARLGFKSRPEHQSTKKSNPVAARLPGF
jgi:hypothetical protein